MSPKELGWLFTTARGMDSIVEIGCWKGRSTQVLLEGCPGKVYAVDKWCGTEVWKTTAPHLWKEVQAGHVYSEFLKNVGHYKNLEIRKAGSPAAAKDCPTVDMVFIDGDHSYEAVKLDIEVWMPKTRKLLCGHDYEPDYPGVQQAVNEAFDRKRLSVIDHIWAVKMQL